MVPVEIAIDDFLHGWAWLAPVLGGLGAGAAGSLFSRAFGASNRRQMLGLTRGEHELNLEFGQKHADQSRSIDNRDYFGTTSEFGERDRNQDRFEQQFANTGRETERQFGYRDRAARQDYGYRSWSLGQDREQRSAYQAQDRSHAQSMIPINAQQSAATTRAGMQARMGFGLTPQEAVGAANPGYGGGGGGAPGSGSPFGNVQALQVKQEQEKERADARQQARAQTQNYQGQMAVETAKLALEQQRVDNETRRVDNETENVQVNWKNADTAAKQQALNDFKVRMEAKLTNEQIQQVQAQTELTQSQTKLNDPDWQLYMKMLSMGPENMVVSALATAAESHGVNLFNAQSWRDNPQTMTWYIRKFRYIMSSRLSDVDLLLDQLDNPPWMKNGGGLPSP